MSNVWYSAAELRHEVKNRRRRQPEFAPPVNPNAPVVVVPDRNAAILTELGGVLLLENGGALLLED